MTNWVVLCCAVTFGICVLNLPLPFLLFEDIPSSLKLWALSSQILINLHILLMSLTLACLRLAYATLLSYLGLLAALSGLLSEILINQAELSSVSKNIKTKWTVLTDRN